MKAFFSVIGTLAAAGIVFYLYQRQLGAISFFLLAIFFFVLSYRQFTKKEKADAKTYKKAREQ